MPIRNNNNKNKSNNKNVSNNKKGRRKRASLPSRSMVTVNNNNSNRGPASSRMSRVQSRGIDRHIVTPHGAKYMLALVDPLNDAAKGCYIPDTHAGPSFKISGKGRTLLSVPGNSQVIVFPVASLGSDTPMFLTISGLISAFSAANAYFAYTTAPVGLTYSIVTNASLPFNQQTLYTNEINSRHVSTGIRVRYTGSWASRGGTVVWLDSANAAHGVFDQPDLTGTLLGTLVNAWMSRPQTRFCSFASQDSHEFVHTDQHYDLLERGFQANTSNDTFNTSDIDWHSTGVETYAQTRFGNSASGQAVPWPRSVFVLTNSNNSTVEYTIDFVTHGELRGGTVIPMHTPSPVHLQDVAAVRGIVAQSKDSHAHSPDMHPKDHALKVMNLIETVGSTVATSAAKYALNEAKNPANIAKAAGLFASMFL